jgi:N-acetylneuraminic acid mutarotase
MLPNGDIIVTGGQNANRTSIYQLASGKWNAAQEMSISRGYASSALLSNGKVCLQKGMHIKDSKSHCIDHPFHS